MTKDTKGPEAEPENPAAATESPAEDGPIEGAAVTESEINGDAPSSSDGEDQGADDSPWSNAAISAAEQEIAELKDRLLRALAENENLIRRGRREREDATKYATANFARDVLTVSDNLRRALDAAPESLTGNEDAKVFLDGVEMTERELLSAMERHGITRIAPMGKKFDHNEHEALFEVPTDEVEPGTVIQVVENGYLIHDRLLRAAKVGVAKAMEDSGGHNVDTTA
jgi:molecular chaperone GrpE